MNLENADYAGGGGSRRSFARRLRGAVLVDATVYEEVEHDPGALPQAAAVVALAALAGGLGGFEQVGFVQGVIQGFMLWALGAGVVWAIGVGLLGHTSDYPELLRALGFALAPQILFVLGVLPLGALTGLLALAVVALSVLAWVVAARQALDTSTGQALAICAAAFLLAVLLTALIPGL